jgi:hypothetical protein
MRLFSLGMPSYTVFIVEGASITHTIDRELAHIWSLEKIKLQQHTGNQTPK